VPSGDAAAAASRFYKSNRVHVVRPPAPSVWASRSGNAERLLARVGVGDRAFTLLLGANLTGRNARRVLETGEGPARLVADGLWLRLSAGEVTKIGSAPPAGAVLAALMGEARTVVALEPNDPRLEEASTLGVAVAPLSRGEAWEWPRLVEARRRYQNAP